jgi:hypothetical protein
LLHRRPLRSLVAFLALVWAGLFGSGARAQAAPGQPYVHRGFGFRSTTAARYNPLGLSTFLRFGYQEPLLGPQPNVLLQRTAVALNGVATLTPAYFRTGLRADIQPLAFFYVLASYEHVGFWGTFDSVQSFTGVDQDFSDKSQSARADAGLSYPTRGTIFTLEPVLQARVGLVQVVSTTDFINNRMRLRNGDPLYYDLPLGLLAPNHGWLVSNETDVLYGPATGLQVGLRHGLYHASYARSDVRIAPARARATTPVELLGPLVVYSFFSENEAKRFNDPAVFLCVAWWLRHPYRTGAEVSQAVPYAVLGWTFRGDFQ